MKRLISAALAAVIGLGAVAATASSASADWYGRPGWHGPAYGPGWGRPGWGRPGWGGGGRYYYGPGYRGGYYGGWVGNPGAAAAAGALLGLGVGAAIASQPRYGYEVPPPAGVAWRGHVAYCQDRYRSYNAATDTFTGYDGRAYRCVGSY